MPFRLAPLYYQYYATTLPVLDCHFATGVLIRTTEILQIVRPVSCLIVVDVQNDFISGSLAISNCPAGHDGLEVSLTSLSSD